MLRSTCAIATLSFCSIPFDSHAQVVPTCYNNISKDCDPLQHDIPKTQVTERPIDAVYHDANATDPQRTRRFGHDLLNKKAKINVLYGEMHKHKGEWLGALNQWKSASASASKLRTELDSLLPGWASNPVVVEPFKSIIEEKKKELVLLESRTPASAKKGEIQESEEKAKTAHSKFMLRRDALAEMAMASPPVNYAQNNSSSPVNLSKLSNCLIDTTDSRLNLKPTECSKAYKDANLDASPTRPSFADKYAPISNDLIPPSGVTTLLEVSGGSSKITLKAAGEFRLRAPFSGYDPAVGADKVQKTAGWGYSFGLSTTAKEGEFLNFNERDKRSDLKNPLDRLQDGTVLTGSIYRRSYDVERSSSFNARSLQMFRKVRKACIDDQKTDQAVYSICEREQLIAWVFRKDPLTNEYKHPAEVKAYNELYFGQPEHLKVARWGMGGQLELSFPTFSWKELPDGHSLDQILSPPDTETWRNVDQSSNKTSFTATLFGHYRLSGRNNSVARRQTSATDFVVVPSITYKQSWEADGQRTVCPAADTSSAFEQTTCTSFADQAPDRVKSWVPSLEARWQFNRPYWGLPRFGIAPSVKFDTHDDRFELRMPIYFTVGSDDSLSAGIGGVYRTGGQEDTKTLNLDTNVFEFKDLKDEAGVFLFVGKTFNLQGF